MSRYFSVHNHSTYSTLDAMTPIERMVSKAVENGWPGFGLTDHGVMSGALEAYKRSKKAGILPFLGEEFYIVEDVHDKEAKRFHVGMIATSFDSYRALVFLSSLSHQRDHYHHKPRIDYNDIARLAADGWLDEVVCTTGCYFGVVAQTLLNQGERAALQILKGLAKWIPNTFVEIQHHHTKHDDAEGNAGCGMTDTELAHGLYDLADAASLPVIVTADSHYAEREHKDLHDFYKRIAYVGSSTDDSFPGDSYHLMEPKFVKDHFKSDSKLRAIWNEGLASCDWLVENHRLELPALDKYKFQVPVASSTPLKDLRKMCMRTLKLRIEPAKRQPYLDWLEDELSVIKDTGFADYFLLINKIISYCRNNNILVNARGSANGSLVCWLLGITRCDPIRWKLSFERFLTRDRGKPPDIDLDIEDVRREEVIAWMAETWKDYDVIRIGTYLRLTIDDTGGGSLVQQYLTRRRNEDKRGEVTNYLPFNAKISDIADTDPDDADKLIELNQFELKKAPGVHAAGVVLASKVQPLMHYIPTMLIPSSGNVVTQMVMDDVEDAGYVKVDALGLRALHTVHVCLDYLDRDIADYCDWIPLDDSFVFKFLRRGIADTGIFQFEGWTSAKGCREVGVRDIDDMILVNALYRPATINAGHKDTYVWNRKNPGRVTYLHDFYEDYLKETFGVPVYQEQVMAILRGLGFPSDDLNRMLKAIKASNDKVTAAAATFASLHDDFLQRCRDVGMNKKQADESWALVQTFSEYSFNRAHSTAYGLLGYWMAYLKLNHKMEFHAALLNTTAGTDKEEKYVEECRKRQLPLAKVDVNRSDALWSLDKSRNVIRRGLLSIKGVGASAANALAEHKPYESVEDMIARLPAKAVTGGKNYAKDGSLIGVYAKLRDAGALRSLGVEPE